MHVKESSILEACLKFVFPEFLNMFQLSIIKTISSLLIGGQSPCLRLQLQVQMIALAIQLLKIQEKKYYDRVSSALSGGCIFGFLYNMAQYAIINLYGQSVFGGISAVDSQKLTIVDIALRKSSKSKGLCTYALACNLYTSIISLG